MVLLYMGILRSLASATLSAAIFAAQRLHAAPSTPLENLIWPKQITVSGFFGSGFGLARAAERTAAGLESRGFKVTRHDVTPLLQSKRLFLSSVPGRAEDGWIMQVNGPEVPAVLARISPGRHPKALRVGYWAWELPVVPADWHCATKAFHAIIAPSSFTRCALSGLGKPTFCLPHPVEISRRAPKVSAEPYTFLVQMDGNSTSARKNISAAIHAFKQCMKAGTQAALLVKTQNLTQNQRSAVQSEIEAHDSIQWLDRNISDAEMDELIGSVDCIVSSHRSEGFGLALAEAIGAGLDAVATGWSGNVDFMKDCPESLIEYTLVPVDTAAMHYGRYMQQEAVWAEIDVNGLVETMDRLAKGRVPQFSERLLAGLQKNAEVWNLVTPGSSFLASFQEQSKM